MKNFMFNVNNKENILLIIFTLAIIILIWFAKPYLIDYFYGDTIREIINEKVKPNCLI